ncbi:MAG: single-stranded-DNA-specific exonuclease RecJ [Betaproteobacteria bacterium]
MFPSVSADLPRVAQRALPPGAVAALTAAGIHPVLARVYAGRGLSDPAELDTQLSGLLPFRDLLNVAAMATILADAIKARRRLLIVGDYDADGATASALGMLALRRFGAVVDFLVPNRFDYGYGLTPEIVRIAAERQPDFIITVDNGIASNAGVEEARRLGIEVLVTDHHLPGTELPRARCIVNPNQAGCPFASKHLAGVGVMFYVLLALRAELRQRGAFASAPEPNLAEYLDIVALGTIADVVQLDRNNRILVTQGLRRIQAGRTRPGISALLQAAGRDATRASTYDLGFVVGPRLNAAGRLEDMTVGIDCLLTDDQATASRLAARLDALNRDRREIEADMQASALAALERIEVGESASLAMFDPAWHTGVVGLLASRLKERFHRPTFCFAAGAGDELKGSGRSIPALHLRDALDLVDRRHPGLITRFGGHAAAAGLSLPSGGLDAFRSAFERVVRQALSPADLERVVEIDGSLDETDLMLPVAEALGAQVWGQGFAAPQFRDEFRVDDQRVVGGRHLRLRLLRSDRPGSVPIQAMLFGHDQPLPARIAAVYRLDVNEWNGARTLQLTLGHWQPA